jgi:NADH dehydrogenase
MDLLNESLLCPMNKPPQVIVIGAGFAGLWAARTLARQPVQVLLIDSNNFHTFQPLLYQVATAGIEPEAITYPVRGLLRKTPNLRFRLAMVAGIDPVNRLVTLAGSAPISYDYLILATGSTTRYHGIPGAETCAFPLKTIDEAIQLRNHILRCFEEASRETDPVKRRALLTFVVVGGGATGVEFAGALAELIKGPVKMDYPEISPTEIKLILMEASNRLLNGFPETLAAYTVKRLQAMGVEVRLQCPVARISPEALFPVNGDPVETKTVAWVAGVTAHAPVSSLSPAHDDPKRISVNAALQAAGHERIFVAGDLADCRENGHPLPIVAPVAIQQGVSAAQNILRLLRQQPLQPFKYFDKGSMVTIGRNAAVATVGKLHFTGFIAWILWLVLHLYQLIGFRNRVLVLINWAWDYFSADRAVRVILPTEQYRCRPFLRGCGKETTGTLLPPDGNCPI